MRAIIKICFLLLIFCLVLPAQAQIGGLKPAKKKKKSRNDTEETPTQIIIKQTNEEENSGVLQNPSGFEMFEEETAPATNNSGNNTNANGNLNSAENDNTPILEPTNSSNNITSNTDLEHPPLPENNTIVRKSSASKNGETLKLDLSSLYDTQSGSAKANAGAPPNANLSFKMKEDIKYFYNQAILKVAAKDYKTAIDLLNKCIKADKHNKELLQLRANCYAEVGETKKAIKDYKAIVKFDQKDPVVYYNLGVTYLKLAKFKDAIMAYSHSVQLKPDYINAYQGRATAKTYINDYESAIEDYNAALDLKNYFTPAIKGRGVAKCMLNRYDEAVNDFSYILELQPDDGLAYYYRGLAYYSLNQTYKGCNDIEKASQLNVARAAQDLKELCR
ncbi:MAG: tetratricopeptide repeat protein [Sphingobacteriales bacterium]|jgi:tetratricopeptide (TPR) repeat protein|nr:tetratricopeptide repeat protein [Sphingobacteriales bacterium]MBP9140199.1 tetratricopeptide repeat protein [Chitinophagales bacterium]MDA0197667.1 tetratricopeptide repeat protein [Bacteroidota bacterium]MBK6888974.1 tetratricopeptide repeat protein [Sphingobacteriales bacterium]MBK7528524.1 tetratricopeptide repeat protein [Sphingobacteriales bacterium]